MDEFNERSGDRTALITQLRTIVKHDSVRLMVTSRHNAGIESCFPEATSMEIRASDQDVRAYLESHTRGESPAAFRVKLDPALQQSIMETVVTSAEGR